MGRNLPGFGTRTGHGRTATGRHALPSVDRARSGAHAAVDIEDDGLAEAVVFLDAGRRLFASDPLTRGDVADYYRQVAPWLLPEAAYRPLALRAVAPDGALADAQMDHRAGLGSYVHPFPRHPQGGDGTGFYIGGVTGLLQLVQADAFELEAGAATIGQPTGPDRLVLGLDAAPAPLADTALALRTRLQAHGLASFVRLSGDGGLHVVAPLAPGVDWETLQEFAAAIIEAHAAGRDGDLGVRIRALATTPAQTATCSWSLRRGPAGIGVAMPLGWDALAGHDLSVPVAPAAALRQAARLREDPWAGMSALRQTLPG